MTGEPLVVVRTTDTSIPDGTIARTPDHLSNVKVLVDNPVVTILVRALRTFLQSILTMLSAVTMTNLLPASEFSHKLFVACSLSIGITVVCIIQNVLEFLNDWDKTHPTLRG